MTELREPPRLLDPGTDLPDWQRAPLEAGTRDLPRPERLARIAALLPGAPTGSSPIDPRPPTPPVAPAIPSAIPGAVAGALLGLALVGAGWIATPRSAPQPGAPHASIATVVAAAPEPPPPPATKPAAPRPRAAPERPSAAGPPVPSAPEPPATATGLAPDPSTAAANVGPETPEAEPETALLKRAQDALRADPARALSLTEIHRARFPGGVLSQEREVLAVSALLGMGRGAEARARATRFVAAYPTSMHRRRLSVLIPDLESSDETHKEPASTPSTP